jgi:(1->4)-alpha-D-glucan 1-alpha-D-glucosylmutase
VWDSSLVDPDNRRPVDFAARRALLEQLDATAPLPTPCPLDPAVLDLADERGLAKLHTIRTALAVRRARPSAFAGAYCPLSAHGAQAEAVFAFQRGAEVISVVGTRPWRLTRPGGGWGDTTLELPDGWWYNELTGERWSATVSLARLLERFPVALLTLEPA